jgi:hypothetical protein
MYPSDKRPYEMTCSGCGSVVHLNHKPEPGQTIKCLNCRTDETTISRTEMVAGGHTPRGW